ncbi:hypothetical protein Tco_0039096 [Tanacetum coccineum]
MQSGETSKSMISKTQSHTYDYVEEANDAKVQREAKASKERCGWLSDTLASEKLDVEDQKWWLDARQLYADQLPKLLIQSEGRAFTLGEELKLAIDELLMIFHIYYLLFFIALVSTNLITPSGVSRMGWVDGFGWGMHLMYCDCSTLVLKSDEDR